MGINFEASTSTFPTQQKKGFRPQVSNTNWLNRFSEIGSGGCLHY